MNHVTGDRYSLAAGSFGTRITHPGSCLCFFAIFAGLFALDVLGVGSGFWKKTLALLIHLIPTAMVLVAIAISWRWDLVRGLLLVALGPW
jgi:hypothetical protein